MTNEDAGSLTEPVAPDTDNELRAKKGIGVLDAILLSMGFTTSNLQHIITPVAQGGLGVGLASTGAAIAGVAVVSVSTIAIAVLISYSVFQLIDQSARETAVLIKKQKELAEKQIMFFARLMYVRHLLNMSGHTRALPLSDQFQTRLALTADAANALAETVETIYREEKEFSRVIRQRDRKEESEEKAIQRFFSAHAEEYLPRIQEGLSHLYVAHPAAKKNWRPELVGAFAGFISFISMSSGFIGAYSSVVTLAVSIAAINLAIPILGWIIFGASLLFALGIGLMVRRYTDKSMKRQEVMDTVQEQDAKLVEGLSKIHEVEIMLLNERVARFDRVQPEFKHSVAANKNTLTRSRSWSGTFFDHQPSARLEAESKVDLEDRRLRIS